MSRGQILADTIARLEAERFAGPPWAPLPKPKRRQNPPEIEVHDLWKRVPRDHPADCEVRQAQLLHALDGDADLVEKESA